MAEAFSLPDTLGAPFGYSHVVDSPDDRIVYISGQVPLDSDGQLVARGTSRLRRVRSSRT